MLIHFACTVCEYQGEHGVTQRLCPKCRNLLKRTRPTVKAIIGQNALDRLRYYGYRVVTTMQSTRVCVDCGREHQVSRRGLCPACAAYLKQHGERRSLFLARRDLCDCGRKATHKNVALSVGNGGVELYNLCDDCMALEKGD